jgi:Transposase IS116/IS110/IS902 family
MMIIGVDYHPSFHTIAFLVEKTGECGEQELNRCDGQAEKFYCDLKQRGIGIPTRFQRGKQISNYLGMVPREDSNADKQRLGHISKLRQFVVALLAGGGGPGGGTCQLRPAPSVHSPGDASAPEHCQGSDGTPSGGSLVLDMAKWL